MIPDNGQVQRRVPFTVLKVDRSTTIERASGALNVPVDARRHQVRAGGHFVFVHMVQEFRRVARMGFLMDVYGFSYRWISESTFQSQ